MIPQEIIKKVDIEISFYIDQINKNIKFLSQYDRYINDNKEFIDDNPEKEAEFFEDAYNNYHSYFPYLINNSLLVAFDSYAEYKLQLIYNEFCKEKIERTRSYIKYYNDNILANYSIDIGNTKYNWGVIEDLHSIRNKIVHFNSSLSKSFQPSHTEILKVKKSKIYNLLMKYKKHLDYNEFTTRFYIVDDKLLSIFLNSIKNYLTHILNQIPERV